jgi:hypothetical protein
VTVWANEKGTRINAARAMTLAEMERVFRAVKPADCKEALPLWKLARFGGTRTERGALRHDANVVSVHGIVVDYDAKRMPMAEAVKALRSRGIAALFHTTSTHEPDAPKWRGIFPLAVPLEGDTDCLKKQHRHYVAAVNGMVGGVLASESKTLSQSYYFGPIKDRPPPELVRLEGACLDEWALAQNEPLVLIDPGERADPAGNGSTDYDTTPDATLRAIIGGDDELARAHSSSRHQAMITYAGRLMRREVPDAEIELALHEALGKNPPPHSNGRDPHSTVREIVQWVRSRHGDPRQQEPPPDPDADPKTDNADSALSPLPFKPLADIQPRLKNQYLVKGLIKVRTTNIVRGASNSGKTFAVIDLSLCIASGHPWRGRKVQKGLVVYLAMEAPESVENRLYAQVLHNGAKFPASAPLAVCPQALDLRLDANVQTVIAFIRAMEAHFREKCVLVIVDTLARAIPGGDECSSRDMGQVIANADKVRDQCQTGVLIVHHEGKDSSKGARGWSGLQGAVDTELAVEDCGNGVHAITDPKQRDAKKRNRYPFKLDVVELGKDEDGDPVTTCTVQHLEEDEAPASEAPKNDLARDARRILDAMLGTEGGREKIWDRKDMHAIGERLGIASLSTRNRHITAIVRGSMTPSAFGNRLK